MFKLSVIGTVKPSAIDKSWCIYELRDAQAAIIYLGMIELVDLFSLKDAKRNPAFDLDAEYILNVLSYHENCNDALKAHISKMREISMPPINRTMYFNRRGEILCNETGERFATQRDVCRQHRTDPAALNRHLQRVSGHKSVGGRTYRYVLSHEIKD